MKWVARSIDLISWEEDMEIVKGEMGGKGEWEARKAGGNRII